MRPPAAALGRNARRLLFVLTLAVGACALALGVLLPGGGSSRASAQEPASEVSAQTDASVPARDVYMMGYAPAGEAWGVGKVELALGRSSWSIVHYAEGSGWTLAPSSDSEGQALSESFEPFQTALAGQMTSSGDAALLGSVAAGKGSRRDVLLVRDAGGEFKETTPVPAEGEELHAGEAPLLGKGEALVGENREPLLAPLDEGGGHAGALVVPVNTGKSGVEENGVLHWDGSRWARERIEVPVTSKAAFRVLAIGASAPGNAWLLAQLSQTVHAGGVALFRRDLSNPALPVWKPVSPAPGVSAGEPLTVNGEPFTVPGLGEPPKIHAQILTVTDEGLWIDGERPDAPTRLTMFFKPDGPDSGHVEASWCNIPEGAKGGTPPCNRQLPEALPSGPSRSLAWDDPSNRFGQRVITGLIHGVSLRLEAESFARVLALGGGEAVAGTNYGAAFSEPRDGWLASEKLPVHLTTHPAPDRLQPYPVPFSHALLAIAPQPGAPVGALSSEALAVGERGEVARYLPGEGWQPESLLGASGRPATPSLRAVAWPTPTRAYAVGELGQMWLWRGETGLWEPDPATPRNFRGDLLGIAFDPNNPSRGYAVGQQGVLLRYGKSWVQEPLPSEVQGASFTSVAFAGSEAIVAYRIPHPQTNGKAASYTAGLLVNGGSGWQVDQSAAAAIGDGSTLQPWAVAALPDGGAAFSTNFGVYERNGQGAPWQPTTAPYPQFPGPGSLALFREGGPLRVIGAGAAPETSGIDLELQPPQGFPPNLVKPYPLQAGYVLRQTAGGWSDEEHDQAEPEPPPGEWAQWDIPYRGDPTSAVLVDPSGSVGWAVGGELEGVGGAKLGMATADISRYPSEPGVAPVGVAATQIQASSGQAAFAIGGAAQCAAPCADSANGAVGPDAWLATALDQASRITGVRAFFYTGPRVTNARTVGAKTLAVPYQDELTRYAALLGSARIPAFAAASPTDAVPGAGECAFVNTFVGFPTPFGNGPEAAGLRDAGRSSEPCTGESQAAYYALDSSGQGGNVRVVVLDDSGDVHAPQLEWLAAQLREAAGRSEPAIVIGDADLNAQITAGDASAAAVAQTLGHGGASAYFYESPEQNVEQPLLGASSVPAFGSGTLGYSSLTLAERQDYIGHNGFLLAEVDAGARDPATNRAPVTARLIPNVGELALEAKDGVLLHRSQQALFAALARRPRAGCLSLGPKSTRCANGVYIPIPANCIGSVCSSAILPEYSFTSSRPEIGDFVEPNLASPDPRAVLLGASEQPIPDAKSGLFCAYNAGTTVVTISAGGFAASLTVTVQAGSVRRPCGTQPLKEVQGEQTAAAPAPLPPPSPAPAGAAPTSSSPPPVPLPAPPPALVTPAVPARPAPPALPPFVPLAALPVPLIPFVPLPVPSPARPSPPTGTSAVTSPVEVAEKEEEEEEATESVSNQAMAYHASEHETPPAYILGVIVLAAFAGASIVRTRRGSRRPRIVPATISAQRSSQGIERERRVTKW